jgi:hypothetical protein
LFKYGPWGWGGATIGKTICTHVYIEKKISRTSGPISIKCGLSHPWVKEILNCLDIGPGPLQRGIITKNGVASFLKKIFSRTTEPEELKFT